MNKRDNKTDVEEMRRHLNSFSIIKEEKESNNNVILYATNDENYKDITDKCRSLFGASFDLTDKRGERPEDEYVMCYNKSDKNVILNGEIPILGNASFRFKLKDSNGGCYVWINPIRVNDDSVRILAIINGVYKNWRDDMLSKDYKPIGLRDDEDTTYPQPGDDIP